MKEFEWFEQCLLSHWLNDLTNFMYLHDTEIDDHAEHVHTLITYINNKHWKVKT